MEKLTFSITFEKMFNRICFEEQTAHLLTRLKNHHEHTYLHSLRVANYCYQIATLIGLTEIDREILTRSALLHDIGKLTICPRILSKETPLTQEEYRLIKMHPSFGLQELKQYEYTNRIDADIILYHHENLDGSGYPHGLKASRLTKNVRIIRVADSFDAMTSSRSYNKAKTITEARIEIQRFRQKNFCPHIVEILDRYLEENFAIQLGV